MPGNKRCDQRARATLPQDVHCFFSCNLQFAVFYIAVPWTTEHLFANIEAAAGFIHAASCGVTILFFTAFDALV